ncbi:Hypothetical_protein [Hexamita inflata]|uniref:Hypothetical_protein n=1 Tax=Hexamita inflata TaxID=28002 RepID=A0AA86N6M7_9EUKA|nr:Hypothetical protein HINF_LOCUS1492 [Hexamita inflata]
MESQSRSAQVRCPKLQKQQCNLTANATTVDPSRKRHFDGLRQHLWKGLGKREFQKVLYMDDSLKLRTNCTLSPSPADRESQVISSKYVQRIRSQKSSSVDERRRLLKKKLESYCQAVDQ